MGREMGEEDAPPAVETEESPAPAEGAPAADDPPPSPPVEAEETPTPADDAPGPSEDSRVDAGVVARGPRTESHHDAGAGAEDLVDCTFVVLPERFEHSATIPATEPFASVKSMLASSLPIPLDAVMTLRQPDGGEPLPDDACLADYGVGAADEVELELVVAYRTEREMRAEAEENARREAEDFARLEEEAAAAAAAEAAAAEEARLADTSGPSLPETLRVTVRGARKGEPSRVVTVRIDASGCRKPRYLGDFATGATEPCTTTRATRRSRRNPARGRPSSPPRRRRWWAGPGGYRPKPRRPRRWRGRISSWTNRGTSRFGPGST